MSFYPIIYINLAFWRIHLIYTFLSLCVWNNPWYVYLVLITSIIYNSLRLCCSYLYTSLCCCNDPISPEGSLKFHLSPLIHFSPHSFLPGAARSKPNKLVVILDFSSRSWPKSPVFFSSHDWKRSCQRLLFLVCNLQQQKCCICGFICLFIRSVDYGDKLWMYVCTKLRNCF